MSAAMINVAAKLFVNIINIWRKYGAGGVWR
jgi:hypothetical protein